MVSTRRGAANAESASSGTKKSTPKQMANDAINVLQLGNKNAGCTPVTPKISSAVLKATPSSNISDHDLSLTSPITGDTPAINMTTPKKQQDLLSLPERAVSSALRRLASKPFDNMSGSSHNPIVVNENSSPPRPAVRAPKRKQRHRKLPEPHKFIDQGYRDLYNYNVARAPLSALPANGSTFTGHQSHDMYRMMNAKITVAPNFSPNEAWGRDSRNVPFQVQYPISAQYLAQQQAQQQVKPLQPPPYAQYYQYQASPNPAHMIPSQNEDMLRKKAVQYIREVSQPSPCKSRLSDADPNETSASENDTPKTVLKTPMGKATPTSKMTPATKSTPQSALMSLWGPCYTNSPQKLQVLQKPQILQVPQIPQKKARPVVYQDPDPQIDLDHLVERTSLITSLLQTYPHSKDQKGLREDISNMMNVQNKHMTEWMMSESQIARKRRKIDDDKAVAVASAAKVLKEQDSALRNVFSANADMWQDGTGDGVADVFAAEPVSTPIASSTGGAAAHTIETADAVGATGSPVVRLTSTEIQVASHESKASSLENPEGKPASPDKKSKNMHGTPISPTGEVESPTGKSADAVKENTILSSKPATPDSIVASPDVEESSQLNDKIITRTNKLSDLVNKSSDPNDELPAVKKSPQPNNKLLTPSQKYTTPISKRLSPRKPLLSFSANKLHVSSNKVPSSRDVTPTPSSFPNSESSDASTFHRPVFRFERKAAVDKPAASPRLQRQDTTESMKKVDAELGVLTKEYPEAYGLGAKKVK